MGRRASSRQQFSLVEWEVLQQHLSEWTVLVIQKLAVTCETKLKKKIIKNPPLLIWSCHFYFVSLIVRGASKSLVAAPSVGLSPVKEPGSGLLGCPCHLLLVTPRFSLLTGPAAPFPLAPDFMFQPWLHVDFSVSPCAV